MKNKLFSFSAVVSGIASTIYLIGLIRDAVIAHREVLLFVGLLAVFLGSVGMLIYEKINEYNKFKEYVFYTSENLQEQEFLNLETKIKYLINAIIKNYYKKEGPGK